MLMAGTGARTGQMGMEGLVQNPGANAAPNAFEVQGRPAPTTGPGGIPGLFAQPTPGLAGPIRRRMRHPRAHGAVNQIPRAMVKSPIMPGTRKGLQTRMGA